MHAVERQEQIVGSLRRGGFVTVDYLCGLLHASPATIRRDLDQLERSGQLARVRGGAVALGGGRLPPTGILAPSNLGAGPASPNVSLLAKQAIGRVARNLLKQGEGILVGGGTTTLEMCRQLAGLKCQVLTYSLPIVSCLVDQPGTQILIPSGMVRADSSNIEPLGWDDPLPRFHAPKLFLGASALSNKGLIQCDPREIAVQHRLIERAESVIVLADSRKFVASTGPILCGLDQVQTIITDSCPAEMHGHLARAGVEVILAE